MLTPQPQIEGFTPRPISFRRFCVLCMDAIRKEFVLDRDPKTLTKEEKQPYFFEVGTFTDLDPQHEFPLCQRCAGQITPHVDSALHLDPQLTTIERRHYHGRVRHGRIRFFLSVHGARKRWADTLVAAIAYRMLTTSDHVWCDGAWLYGLGCTREYLKLRAQAQFLGMNAEQQAA